MSCRRLLTSFAAGRIPCVIAYSNIRAIHILPRISTCLSSFNDKSNVDQHQRLLLTDLPYFRTLKRYKSGKKKQKQAQAEESDDDDDEDEADSSDFEGQSTKVITMTVNSMRLDLVVKAGMGMSRAHECEKPPFYALFLFPKMTRDFREFVRKNYMNPRVIEREFLTSTAFTRILALQITITNARHDQTCYSIFSKAEVALYESKIRVNGQKIPKKSYQAKIGDVIDMIRGPSPKNPDFIVVTRLVILSAMSENSGYRIKYTRDKSLVIENYDDVWTPVES